MTGKLSGNNIQIMELIDVIPFVDSEIARLREVRSLLTRQNGRDGSLKAKPAKQRRTMSAEARKRIRDAQRRRWAAQKKAAKRAA
jgi:hypothetical protein